jgi:hypothetical protein
MVNQEHFIVLILIYALHNCNYITGIFGSGGEMTN